jgi:hypothetical protein
MIVTDRDGAGYEVAVTRPNVLFVPSAADVLNGKKLFESLRTASILAEGSEMKFSAEESCDCGGLFLFATYGESQWPVDPVLHVTKLPDRFGPYPTFNGIVPRSVPHFFEGSPRT